MLKIKETPKVIVLPPGTPEHSQFASDAKLGECVFWSTLFVFGLHCQTLNGKLRRFISNESFTGYVTPTTGQIVHTLNINLDKFALSRLEHGDGMLTTRDTTLIRDEFKILGVSDYAIYVSCVVSDKNVLRMLPIRGGTIGYDDSTTFYALDSGVYSAFLSSDRYHLWVVQRTLPGQPPDRLMFIRFDLDGYNLPRESSRFVIQHKWLPWLRQSFHVSKDFVFHWIRRRLDIYSRHTGKKLDSVKDTTHFAQSSKCTEKTNTCLTARGNEISQLEIRDLRILALLAAFKSKRDSALKIAEARPLFEPWLFRHLLRASGFI